MSALLFALVIAATPLDDARDAYQAGRLDEAQRRLEPLLYPLRLDDPALEREARFLLAGTYFAQGDRNRSEEEVVRAWGAGDDAPLDPLAYPPDFVAFAEQAKARHAARIAALRMERAPRPPPDAPLAPPADAVSPPPVIVHEPAPERMAAGWALLPFGAPQYRQERPVAGTVFAVAQGTCLATAAGGLVGALSLRGDDGLYSRRDAPTARALNTAWVAGAWCFVGVYGLGAVDALLNR